MSEDNLIWELLSCARLTPEGDHVCKECNKKLFMHPNYIKLGVAWCSAKGCSLTKSRIEIAKIICKARRWKFLKIEKSNSLHGYSVTYNCEEEHENTKSLDNLRKGGGICKKCTEDPDKIRGKRVIPFYDCDCKEKGEIIESIGRCRHHNHAFLCPDALDEWNYDKNNGLIPWDIAPCCNTKFWYTCSEEKCGNDYQRSPRDFMYGLGCPFCSGRRVSPQNCLATLKPEIAKLWSPKNDFPATEITCGSGIIALWICENKEHGEHRCEVDAKVKGRGCPKCNVIGYEQKVGGHDYFVKKANEVHENKYEYPGIYEGNHTKTDIKCREHGNFSQTPAAHKSGEGCPKCFIEYGSPRVAKVLKILDCNNIKYNIEHTIEGMSYKKDLRIDFFIYPNIAIEIDDISHFRKMWEEIPLEETQKRDKIKDKFCLENKIHLYRIPYIQNLSEEFILEIIEKMRNSKMFIYASYQHYISCVFWPFSDKDSIDLIVVPSPKLVYERKSDKITNSTDSDDTSSELPSSDLTSKNLTSSELPSKDPGPGTYTITYKKWGF